MYARHKNTKRLSNRTSGGQFAGTPNLGATVCSKCGAIHLPEMREDGSFIVKVQPTECKNGCGPLKEASSEDQER